MSNEPQTRERGSNEILQLTYAYPTCLVEQKKRAIREHQARRARQVQFVQESDKPKQSQ